MGVMTILESIGVFAFAISGAYVAIQKNMDLFGLYTLAIVTAMGGGIMRDVVMSRGVPVFFSSYRSVIIILLAATLVIVLKTHQRWLFLITVMDAVGLAVFTVDTAIKALESGYNLLAFLFVSVITAVGGGVIRDILCNRVPVIFRKDIYATTSLAGALLFWVLVQWCGVRVSISTLICVPFIVALRLLGVFFSINLPRFQPESGEKRSVEY